MGRGLSSLPREKVEWGRDDFVFWEDFSGGFPSLLDSFLPSLTSFRTENPFADLSVARTSNPSDGVRRVSLSLFLCSLLSSSRDRFLELLLFWLYSCYCWRSFLIIVACRAS